ncbi:hypothetical protein [Mesorhizobium sp. SARCC-RB16n]|uniref:hypothetical protein n=1 Tax=Mesorhizobium sp. SARCC-RB16n TaxID=2116687 RepID=UPI001FEF4876|nr:hypothetical protein [Mesorhizobium sp. SARCC-RB16n]
MENLFASFDKHLARAGYLAMGGQIVDATMAAAPSSVTPDAEKAGIKAGKFRTHGRTSRRSCARRIAMPAGR